MEKIIVLIFISLFFSLKTEAQVQNDSVVVKRDRFRGTRYFHDGQKVGFREMKNIVRQDPAAAYFLGKAKRKKIVCMTVGYTGAAYALYEILTPDMGNRNLGRAFIGIGVEAMCLPLAFSAGRDVNTAINTYNKDLHKGAFRNIKPEYYLSCSGSAVALTVKF